MPTANSDRLQRLRPLRPAHAEVIEFQAALLAELGCSAAGVVEERSELGLLPAQQFLLESIAIEASADGQTLEPVRRTQDDRWAANIVAARQASDDPTRPAARRSRCHVQQGMM
ncbi:hypothetical protein [Streptomyces fagopyri]|uniref:hypothetical protein n=1 Tax=Streptomyces fagopyri TaxID=2662397 RepID=UPI0033DE4EE3